MSSPFAEPRPNDDGDGRRRAGPLDLAAGLARTLRWWLIGLAVAVGLLLLLLWGTNRPDDPELGEAGGPPSTPADGLQFDETQRQVGDRCLSLLVADTPAEWRAGLRGRESELERVDGMLFVSSVPAINAFTMRGVTAPLSLGFYDANGGALGGHDMVPCPAESETCPSYDPPAPYAFVVETALGELPEGPLGGGCEG